MFIKDIAKPLITLAMYCFRIFPIKNNKIIFSEYSARKYGDNPKYIAEEIIKEGLPFDCVFVLNDPDHVDVMDGIRKVKYNSIPFLYELTTAKFWVDNTRKQPQIVKRKGQYYIQTWHGGIALKRIEKDAADSLDDKYIRTAKNDSKNIDLLIASSDWGEKMMRRAFWYDGNILKAASARLDPLFDSRPDYIDSIRNSLGIPAKKRIILYAPTFRASQRDDVYDIDFKGLFVTLENKFGGEWLLLAKLHPNISTEAFAENENVVDLTKYQDITKLYLISDILITDYSSTMFDFSLQKKPVFLFAMDIEEYTKDRNFYFDIRKLPFALAENNVELQDNVARFSEKAYLSELQSFHDEIGLVEDGTGAKAVCDIIKSLYV